MEGEHNSEGKAEPHAGSATSSEQEITADTKLKDLFALHPNLKKELGARYAPFKMLNTPLAKIMLQKATIQTAGERSGLGTDGMIKLIREIIG